MLTPQEEEIVRSLYKAKAEHSHMTAYCTTVKPLVLHKWNQKHPVEENTTDVPVPIGTTLKIVMVSRFDDCGLTDDLTAEYGYHTRVAWDSGEITNIRLEP